MTTRVSLVVLLIWLMLLGGYATYRMVFRRRSVLMERLDEVMAWDTGAANEQEISEPEFSRFERFEYDLARSLQRAGLPIKAREFLNINLGIVIVVALATFFASRSPLWALVFSIAWLPVPMVVLRSQIEARARLFDRQISPALTMMENSLSAGNSFAQAMESIASELDPPLSLEFGRVARQLTLGTRVEQALSELTERMESEDLRLVVTAVLIQRVTGGNLVTIIRNINDLVKERLRIRASIRALTAQGRMSVWVVGLLPLGLGFLMYLINPGYMSPLISSPLGWSMVFAAVLSESIGLLWIRRIINIRI